MDSRELKIAFIGAGAANFGGGEGPWDHASRLEKLNDLRVVGIADPDVSRANFRLQQRTLPLYRDARCYADFRAMIAEQRPDAVWIGVPPSAHGTLEPGKDIEVFCAAQGVHMFVEKPLSAARPEAVRPVAGILAKSKVITSVGYMFRYSKAIEKLKEIIDQTPGGAKVFVGQYNCAYSEIRKREWWDVRPMGGPIVEQATHFVDLARCLMGDADLGSVRALALPGNSPAGQLCDIPKTADGRRFDEDVPLQFRHPRATVATWRFASGALGSLTHATLLHREKYDTQIEVWGDGLRVALIDPYGKASLLVRRPHTETLEQIVVDSDDPYLTEDRIFVDAVRSGNPSPIRCTYADALKTFELTWAITDVAASAAEKE
ncbi:MAG TPA: Gfo/Idh/MocA family oxidoreductase [Planctomycetota bacterium]|jgi:predicted dehydrogenase